MTSKSRLPDSYELPEQPGEWRHDPEDESNGTTWLSEGGETAVRVYASGSIYARVTDERVSGFGHGETLYRIESSDTRDAPVGTDQRAALVEEVVDEAVEWMRDHDPAAWSDPAVCEAVFDEPPGYELDAYTVEDRESIVYYRREGGDETYRLAGTGAPEEYTAETCPYLYLHVWNGSGNATVALSPFRGAHGPKSKYPEIEPVADVPEGCGLEAAVEIAREWAAENAGSDGQPSVCTVISCGKAKSLDEDSAETVPARELYSSGTHTCKERFAEHSDDYYIMSANHGLLDPDEEIGYYDEGLDEKTDLETRRWAASVAADLLDVLERGEFDGLALLGRADYVEALEPHFWALPAAVVTPFQTCDDVTGSGTAMRWCNEESHWPENVDALAEIETVRDAEPPECWTMDCEAEAAESIVDFRDRLVHLCSTCYGEPCGRCGDPYESVEWWTLGICRDCQDEIESWSEGGDTGSEETQPDTQGTKVDLTEWSA